MAKVELTVDGSEKITVVKFTTNRMAFSNATKRILNQLYPQYAKGKMTVKDCIDRRHWESNLVIKERIKKQFTNQSWKVVAGWMVDLDAAKVAPKTVADLEAAIYRLWRVQFSLVSNLRLGPSDPNQALGRLAGVLMPHWDKGEAQFKPFKVSMESFEWGEGVELEINTWEFLKEMYWNSNYDFIFSGQAETEIELAEQYFASATIH